MQIGGRIRALRKERKLSLDQLAKRSGVALATLSRMENDKGGGTFRTHQKIVEALGVPLVDLYQGLEEPQQEPVLRPAQGEEPETFTYNEKASALLLTSQITAKQMLPQLIVLQPGGKTTLEQYRRGTERWIFGLEGTVDATVGPRAYRIKKGDTLYFKASLPHQFVNAAASVAKVISVTTPVSL